MERVLCAFSAACPGVGDGGACRAGGLFRGRHERGRKGRPRQPLGARGLQPDCSADGLLLGITDRIGFWTLDGDAVRWTGVAVCATGGVLRIWPVYVLKNRFSGLVAIQAGHKLETRGIYGVIRNPSYLGLLTTSLGWVLAFRSGLGVVLAASLLVPLVARIHAEERLLREHFGAEYEAYCARTWRLVPGIY